MSMLDRFSNAELRAKLLEFGFDIPVSVSKDFMIKKIKSLESKGPGVGAPVKKAAVAPRIKSPTPPVQTRACRGRVVQDREEDQCDGRSAREQGQSATPVSHNSFRTLTRASTGRIIKNETSSSPRKLRSSSVNTRVNTEKFINDYEEDPLPTSHQQQTGQAQFSPIFVPSNIGNIGSHVISTPKSNMFGVVVPGRMVTTEFLANQPVGATKFQLELKEAEKINHLVIFLTGIEPFPPGIGGQIFFGFSNPSNNHIVETWYNLGFITNEKPSCVFKIAELRNMLQQATATFHGALQTAQIGVSMERLEVILQAMAPQNQLEL